MADSGRTALHSGKRNAYHACVAGLWTTAAAMILLSPQLEDDGYIYIYLVVYRSQWTVYQTLLLLVYQSHAVANPYPRTVSS